MHIVMKQIFIIALISLGFSAQAYAQYFPVDTGELNSAYRALQKNPVSRERQVAFFNAFPSTWMEYIMTYQYMCDKRYDLSMYLLAVNHLSAFENMLSQIPDSTYSAKLVRLSIGGRAAVDAPTYLQGLVQRYTLKKPEAIFAHLSMLKQGDQLRFWLFYWHSMFKEKKMKTEVEQLKNRMSRSKPEEVKIMEVGFEYSWGQAPHPPEECEDEYPHAAARKERGW
jgi:hypothetical protein